MIATASVLALLAGSAVAAPARRKGTDLQARLARRGQIASHQTQPLQRVGGTTDSAAKTNGTSHVSYSTNWSGGVISTSAGTFTAVTASFVVPTPSVPSGGDDSTTYSASAWVGIDGDTCGTSILQTGLDFTVQGSSVSYDAWYEWYPDYAYDFSGISFSAGDTVTTTVTADTTTSGTAVITNESTGTTVTQDLTSTAALCEQDAEWIVEDYSSGGSLVPLADWGSVTFTNAVATTSSGSEGPSAGDTIELQQNGEVLTQTTLGDDSVEVDYIG